MIDGWLDESRQPVDPGFKTPEQGAATEVWAVTSPMLEGFAGLYCEDCHRADLNSNNKRNPFLKNKLHILLI